MKILLIWFLMIPALVLASELEIVTLKHRSAEELLPVIRPLLDQGEVASGVNYQLILRTSPHHLAQIKKLLERIDIAPRRLKITVMQNVDSETIARLTGLSVSAGLNREAHITVPGGNNRSGLNVELGQGQDKLKAQVASTRSLEDDRKTQQLQVLEGNHALVRSGQNVPVSQRQVIRHPWGTQVIDSTQYQEVSSGFYVLPRLNGDTVTLEISAQNDSLAPDGGTLAAPVRGQQISSTVSGRLGEWLVAGETMQQKNTKDDTISTRSTSEVHERRSMLIKVEEVID